MLEVGTRTCSKWISKWPPWMASEQTYGALRCFRGAQTPRDKRERVKKSGGLGDLTVLSEHGQRSDEFDPWGVHGDQDHAVLSMSERHIQNINKLSEYRLLAQRWFRCRGGGKGQNDKFTGVVVPRHWFSQISWTLPIKPIILQPHDLSDRAVRHFCIEPSGLDRNHQTSGVKGIKRVGLTCCSRPQSCSCTSRWPVCTWGFPPLWRKSPNRWQLGLDPVKTTKLPTSQHPKQRKR